MLGVLPFVEELDFLCTASTAVPQHLPPCFGVTMLLKVSSIFGVVSTFYSDFFLAFFSSLSSCPMSLQAWGCAPLRWFLKPWVPTWPPTLMNVFLFWDNCLQRMHNTWWSSSASWIFSSASKLLTWLHLALNPWMEKKYCILCTSISTTHDIRYSRQSMLKDPQIERAQNPSNTFTFWFDSLFIYKLQVSYKTSHKANMSDRGNTRKYPIKFFQYPIIPDWLYIWCQYPYPIRTRSDPKYFFQYPIHARPEVKNPTRQTLPILCPRRCKLSDKPPIWYDIRKEKAWMKLKISRQEALLHYSRCRL